jgi:hypothetical protein
MQTPNIEAQRAAMQKLAFLIGGWSGEASVLRGPGQLVDLAQTESAQFKLDGLILMIEGLGRLKSDGTPFLQSLGIISFDDASGQYRMRAFNDGRSLDTEVKLLDEAHAISWGFTLGEMSTHSVLRQRNRRVGRIRRSDEGQPPAAKAHRSDSPAFLERDFLPQWGVRSGASNTLFTGRMNTALPPWKDYEQAEQRPQTHPAQRDICSSFGEQS